MVRRIKVIARNVRVATEPIKRCDTNVIVTTISPCNIINIGGGIKNKGSDRRARSRVPLFGAPLAFAIAKPTRRTEIARLYSQLTVV